MSVAFAENGLKIGLMGGAFDSEQKMLERALPLANMGHTLVAFDCNWFSLESPRKKYGRSNEFLNDERPDLLIGTSLGGLEALVAGINKDFIKGIVTAASPITDPLGSHTLITRGGMLIFPAVKGTRELYKEIVYNNGRVGSDSLHLMHFIGTYDPIIPPHRSTMGGVSPGLPNVEYVLLRIPSKRNRTQHPHTLITQNIYEHPKLLGLAERIQTSG